MKWLLARVREASTHTALAVLCVSWAFWLQLEHIAEGSQTMNGLMSIGEPTVPVAILAALGVVFAVFGVILREGNR